MAERSEICPAASRPVLRLATTESSVVLTLNVASKTRPSSSSILGLIPFAVRLVRELKRFRFRMEHPRVRNDHGVDAGLNKVETHLPTQRLRRLGHALHTEILFAKMLELLKEPIRIGRSRITRHPAEARSDQCLH